MRVADVAAHHLAQQRRREGGQLEHKLREGALLRRESGAHCAEGEAQHALVPATAAPAARVSARVATRVTVQRELFI